jgi:acyl carrier protein
MSEAKTVIHEVLLDVAEEEDLEVTEIRGDEKLVEDLGFRSLTMARILAILEGRLGVDPFAQNVAVTSVRTVDDLCAAYEHCLAGGGVADEAAEAVAQGRQRAEARRAAARNRSGSGE